MDRRKLGKEIRRYGADQAPVGRNLVCESPIDEEKEVV